MCCFCVAVLKWVYELLQGCWVTELLSVLLCSWYKPSPWPQEVWMIELLGYFLPARSVVLLGYLLPAQSVASCLLGILATAVLHLPTLLLYWLSGWCMCNDIITTDMSVVIYFLFFYLFISYVLCTFVNVMNHWICYVLLCTFVNFIEWMNLIVFFFNLINCLLFKLVLPILFESFHTRIWTLLEIYE